ncbi:MAG: hypothetical protein IJK37_06890, partial [Prevotella sp.]|nr:hypothetical protein [Prevotella sp.]
YLHCDSVAKVQKNWHGLHGLTRINNKIRVFRVIRASFFTLALHDFFDERSVYTICTPEAAAPAAPNKAVSTAKRNFA